MKTEIGSILYSKEIETNENRNESSLLHQYLKNFISKEREQIKNIFEKIRQKIPAPGDIHFGYTLLTIPNKNGQNDELVLFRCIQPSPESIFFIEPNGRTYENWNDFVRSNKIPNGCEYFAPSDGVYTANGTISKFTNEKIHRHFIFKLIATATGCILANLFSDAPITSTILRVVMNFYGLHDSVSTMIDKHNHKESIDVSEYLTFFTICLTQLCSVTVYKKEDIFKFSVFGLHWGELALTMTILIVFFLDAYIFYEKSIHFWSNLEEQRISDMISMLLQAFLLWDQFQNGREICELLFKPTSTIGGWRKRSEDKEQTPYQNNERFESTRKAQVKNIMPEKAKNIKTKVDEYHQYASDSIDWIIEEAQKRLGFKPKRKKMTWFESFLGILGLWNGGLSGVLSWVRSFFL